MEIAELESVLAAEELQSFTEAAYRLAYSPSTVSKHIRRVEEELGIKIFERGTKSASVSLTEAGADIIENIRLTVTEYRRMMTRAQGMLGAAQLTVGYMPLISGFGEAAFIAGFCGKYPKVKLTECAKGRDELLRSLESGKLDGIFLPVFGYENGRELLEKYALTPSMECLACGESRDMHLAIASSNPLAARGVATLTELKDEVFVFRTDVGDSDARPTGDSTRTLRRRFAELGLEPRMRFESNIGHRVWQLAAEGKCVIPSARVGMSYTGMSYIRVPDWDNCIQLFFIYLRANDSPAFRTFKKYIIDNTPPKPEAAAR